MSLFDVVYRPLNKQGTDFVDIRREDGHGSTEASRTHVSGDKDLLRVTGSAVIAPNATSTVLSHIATAKQRAHAVIVSGDGDAVVSVIKDSVKQDETRLSVVKQRDSLALGLGLAAGSRIDVTVKCEARATSNFFVVLVYE
jgi:hypothetical protein